MRSALFEILLPHGCLQRITVRLLYACPSQANGAGPHSGHVDPYLLYLFKISFGWVPRHFKLGRTCSGYVVNVLSRSVGWKPAGQNGPITLHPEEFN